MWKDPLKLCVWNLLTTETLFKAVWTHFFRWNALKVVDLNSNKKHLKTEVKFLPVDFSSLNTWESQFSKLETVFWRLNVGREIWRKKESCQKCHKSSALKNHSLCANWMHAVKKHHWRNFNKLFKKPTQKVTPKIMFHKRFYDQSHESCQLFSFSSVSFK